MLFLILIVFNSFCLSCQESKVPTSNESNHTVESVQVETPTVSTEVYETTEDNNTTEDIKIEQPTAEAKTIEVETTVATKRPSQAIIEEPAVTTIEEVKVEEVKAEAPMTEEVVEATPEVQETEEPVFLETVEIDQPEAVASHADFNAILQKHVKNGLVNYAGIKADGQLDAYLDYLSSNAPSMSDTSKDALAFWMNAYNAFTIKLILDNYPLKSIMDLDGGKVWDRKWIKIGGKTLSLNGIEHEIIRPVFNEPRIHFAVVCAAKSCPPIDNKAFFGDSVDAHLESLTKAFINNSQFNQITEKKATVTPIFDWYAKDFGNVKEYVKRYASIDLPAKFKLGYTGYDWALNKQ